jgi:hypothetical protein
MLINSKRDEYFTLISDIYYYFLKPHTTFKRTATHTFLKNHTQASTNILLFFEKQNKNMKKSFFFTEMPFLPVIFAIRLYRRKTSRLYIISRFYHCWRCRGENFPPAGMERTFGEGIDQSFTVNGRTKYSGFLPHYCRS